MSEQRRRYFADAGDLPARDFFKLAFSWVRAWGILSALMLVFHFSGAGIQGAFSPMDRFGKTLLWSLLAVALALWAWRRFDAVYGWLCELAGTILRDKEAVGIMLASIVVVVLAEMFLPAWAWCIVFPGVLAFDCFLEDASRLAGQRRREAQREQS